MAVPCPNLHDVHTQMPFYRPYINYIWCSMWTAVAYACGILAGMFWTEGSGSELSSEVATQVCRYAWVGMAGICACGVHAWYVRYVEFGRACVGHGQ